MGDYMIKAILFDLDDTLYNERDFVFSGFLEVATYLGHKYDFSIDKLYSDIIDIFQKDGRGRVFNILCEKHGFDEDINRLVEIYRDTEPQISLYEDAAAILKKLYNKYKLGIITDGKSSVQWNKIRALGLEEYMDRIIVTDDYGPEFWKPSEKPFLEMINYFGGEPDEFMYIGDNPNKDFVACKRIGMGTVRIIRGIGDHMGTFLSRDYEADYIIYSLLELEKILSNLNCKG